MLYFLTIYLVVAALVVNVAVFASFITNRELVWDKLATVSVGWPTLVAAIVIGSGAMALSAMLDAFKFAFKFARAKLSRK